MGSAFFQSMAMLILGLGALGCGVGVDPFPNLDVPAGALGAPTPGPPAFASMSATGPILATASEVSLITIQFWDANGIPVPGVMPVLSASGTGNTLSCGEGTAQGVATCAFSSTVAETKLIQMASPQVQVLSIPIQVLSTNAFRYTWNAPAGDSTAMLPLAATENYDFTVYWGDGTSQSVAQRGASPVTHTYSSGGIKSILIHGSFQQFQFQMKPERLLDVTFWGTQSWISMQEMFKNCTNLTDFSAPNDPNTLSVTDFSGAFEGATRFNGALNTWSMGSATTLARMFKGAISFNSPIVQWDVARATDFSEMFSSAGIPENPSLLEEPPLNPMAFNQDIGVWDTSSAVNFSRMFAGATSFNANITSWNTSNVTDLSMMFYYATSFNQSLNWDVSNVTTMKMMFFHAEEFNGALVDWAPMALITMERTFAFASKFTQPLNWGGNTVALANLKQAFYQAATFNAHLDLDVSSVTTFQETFRYASAFNHSSVTSWSIGDYVNSPDQVTLAGMFRNASAFNQNLGAWSTSKVSQMEDMFRNAAAYNNGAGGLPWDTSNVSSMARMFWGATNFNADITGWNTSSVSDFSGMFFGAVAFNQPVQTDQFNSAWDVSKATSMAGMFAGASSFNQDLSGWSLASVTDVRSMFLNASQFRNGDPVCGTVPSPPSSIDWSNAYLQDLSRMFQGASCFNSQLSLVTDNAVDMSFMFSGASVFNQDLSGWNTENVLRMDGMFQDAAVFNQNLFSWSVSLVQSHQQFDGSTDLFWKTEWKPLFGPDSTVVKKVFLTASTYTGNLGGISGADAKCMSDLNKPAIGQYRALLSDDSRFLYKGELDRDWVLGAFVEYRRIDGTVIGVAASDKSLFLPLNETVGSGFFWTGLQGSWLPAPENCDQWTSSSATLLGRYQDAATAAWNPDSGVCSEPRHLLCVEQ